MTRSGFQKPWIAIAAAQATAEATIRIRNGLSVDFTDFAIASKPGPELVRARLTDGAFLSRRTRRRQ